MNQTRRELSLAESAAVTNEPLLQLQQVVQQQQQHQQHQNHHHSTVVSEPTQARNFFAQIIHQQLNPQSTSLPTLLTHSLVAFQNQLDNEVVAASVTPTTTTPTTTTSGTNSGDHQQHFRQHQQLQLLHQDHNHHHHQQYLHLQQQQQQQQQHLQQSSTNRQQQLVQQAHRYFTSTNALISSFSSPTSANLSPYSSLSLSPSATDNTFHQQQPIMQSMVAAAGSGTSAAASAAVTATSTAATTTTADWWTEYWSRQPFPSGYTQSSITLLACLITTIIFLIVVGNLLVCIAIFTEKSLRPTQNWFIASLAVSDMLLGLVVMPFSLARELMGFWIFGTLWCDIHEAVDVLLTTASINTLCLISLDRYWSITQAVSYLKKRTPRRGAFMIAFVWILSAAVSLPPLFGWKKPAVPTQAPVNKSTSTTSWPMDIDAYAADNGNQVGGLSQQQQSRYQRLLERRELATPIQSADYGPLPEELLLDQQQNNATTISNAYAANANPPLSPTVIPPLPQLMTSATEYPTCQLSDDLGYVLYSAVGSFFIPCGVMVFTYIKIFLAARSRARRAINKQSRAGQGQNKQRLAARRANLNANQQAPVTHHNQVIGEPSSGAPLTAAAITGSASLKAQAHLQQQQQQSGELMVKGKLVIVERRKSQATVGQLPSASSLGDVVVAPELAMRELRSFAPGAQCIDEKSTAEEADTEQQPAAHRTSTAKIETLQSSDDSTTAITTTNESCTLTTSQAIHASPSALNSAASNDSSMITVMNASMGELPVTMFNFQRPEPQPQASTGGERTTDRKAAALLKAISEADRQLLSELDDANECDAAPAASALEAEGINSSARQVPDIVVERRGTGVSSSGTAVTAAAAAVAASQEVTQEATTNETCFMTIEEDSDIFDAQAGRTIMMIAGTATQRQASGLPKSQVMTMQPSGGQVCDSAQQQIVCSASSAQCRQQPRSASSYCGSSMTINDDDDEDEDDELDECPGDDEELTDECNRYSVSCTLDQCCPAAHCHECELAAGGCTCHLASNGADSPLKHHQHSGDSTAASGTANSGRHQHHQPESRCASDLEAQSMIGDDNVSHMTEYRSNEDLSSSVAGHDVLDATESYHHDKSAAVGGSRKRSLIGFRLTRLGSSGPLSSHSGGLLALVSSQQQQQQQQQHNQQHHHHQQQQQQQQQQVSSSTGKNLKALRQNFFLKLNQLTAKSAAKSTEKSHKSNPSSAHSSGTEHEPSIDCPTTSAIQSNDYPQETTIVDEYEQQTSGDSHHSASKYLVDKELQATRRVSGAVSPHNADKHPASQLTLLARGAAAQANLKAANNQLHQSDDRALLLRATPQDKRMATSNNSTVVAISTTKGKELALRPKSRASGQQNHSLSGSGTKTSGTGGPVSRAYLASDNERHKRKLAKARERRATLILGLIMTTFICSWMPFFTFYVLRAICEDCRKAVSPRIEAFIFWMGYCNSAINPIIYTIFNRDFRKAFRKILFKCL